MGARPTISFSSASTWARALPPAGPPSPGFTSSRVPGAGSYSRVYWVRLRKIRST